MHTINETEVGFIKDFLDPAENAHGLLMCSALSIYEYYESWNDIGRELRFDAKNETFLAVPNVFTVVDHPEDRRRLTVACTDGVFERNPGMSSWSKVGAPPPGVGDSGSFKEPETGEMRATPPVRTFSLCWFQVRNFDGRLFWSLFTGTDTDLYYQSIAGNWCPFDVKSARGGTWSEYSVIIKSCEIAGSSWLVVGSKVGLSFIDKDLNRFWLDDKDGFYNVSTFCYREDDQTFIVLGEVSGAKEFVPAVKIIRFHGNTLDIPFASDQSDIEYLPIPLLPTGAWSGFEKFTLSDIGQFLCSSKDKVYVLDEKLGLWKPLAEIGDCVISAMRRVLYQGIPTVFIGTDNGNPLRLESGIWHQVLKGLNPPGPVKYATSSQIVVWGVQHVRVPDPECSSAFDPNAITNRFKGIALGIILAQPAFVFGNMAYLLLEYFNRWSEALSTAPLWKDGVAKCWMTFAIIPNDAKIKNVLFQTRSANGQWAVTSLEAMQKDSTRMFILNWCRWVSDPHEAPIPTTERKIYGYTFKSWTPDICYLSRFTVEYET